MILKVLRRANKFPVTKENFFRDTKADWSQIDIDLSQLTPDYVSMPSERFKDNPPSLYYYFEDGVIRSANHWGKVRTCTWLLNGEEFYSADNVIGFCPWGDFRLVKHAVIYEINIPVDGHVRYFKDLRLT